MVIKNKVIIFLSLLVLSSCSYAPDSSKVSNLQSKLNDQVVTQSKIDYPSHEPSILKGKDIYASNCSKCHGATPILSQQSIAYMRSRTPVDQFDSIYNGAKIPNHIFKSVLTQEQIWDALWYFRTGILGYYPVGSTELQEMDAIFGGNCAVCHGTRGQGDGNLHKSLTPQPANFKQFSRLYTRSDDKLFQEISHGIPWTAMPAWKDRYDFDKKVSFDDEMRWKLVRYVRQFSFIQEKDRLEIGREKLDAYKESIKGKTNETR